jgi:flavodoxin short chain
MSKIYVVYWSGTGNTKIMAEVIGEGITANGKDAEVVDVSSVKADALKDSTAFALGCPSMGAEQLEESEMEPFVEEIEKFAAAKKIGLFGSYGWGNCEWMRDWEERLKGAGAEIVLGEGVTVLGEPDAETKEKCTELGKSLAAL